MCETSPPLARPAVASLLHRWSWRRREWILRLCCALPRGLRGRVAGCHRSHIAGHRARRQFVEQHPLERYIWRCQTEERRGEGNGDKGAWSETRRKRSRITRADGQRMGIVHGACVRASPWAAHSACVGAESPRCAKASARPRRDRQSSHAPDLGLALQCSAAPRIPCLKAGRDSQRRRPTARCQAEVTSRSYWRAVRASAVRPTISVRSSRLLLSWCEATSSLGRCSPPRLLHIAAPMAALSAWL